MTLFSYDLLCNHKKKLNKIIRKIVRSTSLNKTVTAKIISKRRF